MSPLKQTVILYFLNGHIVTNMLLCTCHTQWFYSLWEDNLWFYFQNWCI